MGLAPKATKAENKVALGITMKIIVGGVFVLMLSNYLGDLFVHAMLRLPFTAVCIAFYVIFVCPAPHNPKKQFWNGMILWLIGKFTPKNYISIIGYTYQEAKSNAKI